MYADEVQALRDALELEGELVQYSEESIATRETWVKFNYGLTVYNDQNFPTQVTAVRGVHVDLLPLTKSSRIITAGGDHWQLHDVLKNDRVGTLIRVTKATPP